MTMAIDSDGFFPITTFGIFFLFFLALIPTVIVAGLCELGIWIGYFIKKS